ncbi:Nas2 N-terminal domain-containing protein [Chloropicon primus]|uniref:26S proteasome non-ATPase regulatory subunit 9 n=1 Tax=Chloropicon primus TaxID=1764295 RepID=A0A5B8MF00_9CHLO|nr:hypothetical protein A3770_02p17360 [Chloropicon primus]UPQ98427.1 Nas2 N-terminal domain-containing protein [Chloropicon primus]|eukprot:QDZ19218.1 hypothetical protein A3770_02p17360 [Chloropicon primus]
MADDDKARAKALVEERDALEVEIERIRGRLNAEERGIGEDAPLVDDEGFPRSDVDVTRVRQDRGELARLYNDHKRLTAEIEQAIHAIHAESRGGSSGHQNGSANGTTLGTHAERASVASAVPAPSPAGPAPYAVVDEIASGSPTERAGMYVGDRIVAFGTIDRGTFGGSLAQVADYARAHEGLVVKVVVSREGALRELELTPCKWDGYGLLGCHMQKL